MRLNKIMLFGLWFVSFVMEPVKRAVVYVSAVCVCVC